MQILSTKLSIPPLRSRLVNRSRLIRKLDQGSECGFVLVSAPAGYGKSTLLSAWLSQAEFATAWLSLDDGDNEPVRFLTYLAAALGKIEPSVRDALDFLPQSSPLPEVDILLTPVVNNLAQIEHPVWLILDDYHLIQNQFVHQAVSFLLEHRPAPLHLVITTRADPPLPLSKLRARSQMVELRLADLRFSSQETEEFLSHVMGLNLSKTDLTFLETSTEGWIAGLQMVGLSLQGKEDVSSFIRSFSGENRYILDFLFDEVFRRQSEELRDFLLKTSILERFCAPLCNAVTLREDSQVVLDSLEHSNLFLIAMDEHRKWYRYHHLFGDLLKSCLKQTFPDLWMLLHQRASAWYAAEQDLENAIIHALAAQDFERTASLVEQVVGNLDLQNKQAMLTSWVDKLPREILETHPWLSVHRAWGYYWTGRREMEEEWLQAAEKAIERSFEAGSPERQHILGHIAAVRAHTALVAENIPRALEMGQKALNLLPDGDEMRCETAVALGAAYWALGDVVQSEQAFGIPRASNLKLSHPTMMVGPTCYAGIQQVKQGRLQDAMATFREGLRMATLPDGSETSIAGFPNVKLGDVLRERNELGFAGQYLVRGTEQCTQFSQPDVLTDAYVCLARYQLAIGDLDGTRETLQKADRVAQQTKIDHWVLCWLDDCHLKAWLAEGNLETASLWAQNSGLTPDGPLSYQHDLNHQNLARVLVAQGILAGSRVSHEKANSLLARLRAAAQQAGWVHEEIKILVMQAVNDQACGMGETALQNLFSAVSLAEPGGYVRVFLDEGEMVRGLLVTLANLLHNGQYTALEQSRVNFQRDQRGRLRGYISMLLAAFDNPGDGAGLTYTASTLARQTRTNPANRPCQGKLMVEPLSERELEVLKLLAQGCSDKRIAESLVIARETVHKHLKNIYGKLDVHSRTEAIARSRELGLF